MSVPPGTEMFQFPGFASTAYVFSCRYPIGVGCPIRTSTDQRLLAAPRGFSQRATSFIASWCQGIHRMPFSCSRTLKVPSQGPHSMHRNHPQITTSQPANDPADDPAHAASRSAHNSHAPEHEPGCWRPDTADRSATPNPPVRHRNQARPETHQNLIHRDKEQNTHPRTGNALPGPPHPPAQRRSEPDRPETLTLLRDSPKTNPTRWWRRSGSNRRPPACKAGALPAELRPQTSGNHHPKGKTPGGETLARYPNGGPGRI